MAAGNANFTIVTTGVPVGQQIAFIVEAVTPARTYRSAPSNPVTAYGIPAGPNVSVNLAARTPNSVTLDVSVDVVSDGGSPVTSYDLTVSGGFGGAQGIPITQRPYRVTVTCRSFGEVCLAGADVTATASLTNAAGIGPPNSTTVNVPAPPTYFRNIYDPVMLVSAGGKCFDRDFALHACNGNSSQLWIPRDLGDILSAPDRACLDHEARTRLGLSAASVGNCRSRDDPDRWVFLPPDNAGNLRRFRGEGLSRCITVLGDPAGEGTPVNLRDSTSQCSGTDQDLWYLYKQQPGVPTTAASLASIPTTATTSSAQQASQPGGDGALGTTGAALILLPVVGAYLRRRRRGLT